MKKSFTLISALLLGYGSFAQSQRMVLAEEFTQASCGPCAAQNPGYNALLKLNEAKAISLKYQTSWPGSDPMNAQNPTDVQTRVDYYNVSGVPDTYVNGNIQAGVAPSQVTQTSINNAYATAAPFDIALSHSISQAQDSIFITMTISCTQAVSGTLKGHVVIAENFIQFATPPGSNGEKEFFYNVARKMLPDADGTTLSTAWTVGQTQTLTFAEKIPTYIYDKNQISVVAFIQDNANKNVKQAAYSAPANDDAAISSVSNVNPLPSCSVNFTPTVKIINKGNNVLTSAVITPYVDGVAGTPIPWSGSLTQFQISSAITLPVVTSSISGAHSYKVTVTEPNAQTDLVVLEDSYTKNFSVFSNAQAYPYTQDFNTSGFPYTNWIVEDINEDAATWTKVSAGSVANGGSAKMNFYASLAGRVDNMYLPSIDLSNVPSTDNVALDFKVAGAPYAAEADQLIVEVSSDCGATWASLWDKSGDDLYTAPATTSAYSPSASHFRDESVNLNAYKGQSKVIIRFKGVSDYGNNVFVDKINLFVANTSSVKEVTGVTKADIFPNPANTTANLRLTVNQAEQVSVEVFNMIGESVYAINPNTIAAGEHVYRINTESLSSGVYMVNIITSTGTMTKKFVVSK